VGIDRRWIGQTRFTDDVFSVGRATTRNYRLSTGPHTDPQDTTLFPVLHPIYTPESGRGVAVDSGREEPAGDGEHREIAVDVVAAE